MNDECVCAKCHEDYSLRENCEPSKYCDRCAHAVLAELEIQFDALEIRAHESRALLQRMVKYVREDQATTPRKTRLSRLTAQVADYLQRTHDPRSILRKSDQNER